MKTLLVTGLILFSSSAFAGSGLVSISTISYPSEISAVTRNVAQLLSNAAHEQCPSGVRELNNISLQFTNTKAVVEKDSTNPGTITLDYATVIATGLVTCK
jgi:hypothetical protein